MSQPLPQLAFLPVERLILHEHHERQRALPLVRRIQISGVFLNPPIVSPFRDGSQRYLVLDGANRLSALHILGFPHALVQVVRPEDPGLSLMTWNHVVWELNPKRFLEGLRAIPGIEWVSVNSRKIQSERAGNYKSVVVLVGNQRQYVARVSSSRLMDYVQVLNAIVDSYSERARLDRVSITDVRPLAAIYPEFSGLIIFPQFSLDNLFELASEGCLLPAGITRFTISPRALHLNYPLDELAADKPIEEKNAALQEWLRQRLARKSVRYYAESTYLFDE